MNFALSVLIITVGLFGGYRFYDIQYPSDPWDFSTKVKNASNGEHLVMLWFDRAAGNSSDDIHDIVENLAKYFDHSLRIIHVDVVKCRAIKILYQAYCEPTFVFRQDNKSGKHTVTNFWCLQNKTLQYKIDKLVHYIYEFQGVDLAHEVAIAVTENYFRDKLSALERTTRLVVLYFVCGVQNNSEVKAFEGVAAENIGIGFIKVNTDIVVNASFEFTKPGKDGVPDNLTFVVRKNGQEVDWIENNNVAALKLSITKHRPQRLCIGHHC